MTHRHAAVRLAPSAPTNRCQSALASDGSLFATLLEEVPTKIVFVDAAGVIRYVNRAAAAGLESLARLLPVPPDRVPGERVDLLGLPAGGSSWADACAHRSDFRCTLGPETLSIRATPVKTPEHSGTLLTWSLVTDVLVREERLNDLAGRMAAIDGTQAMLAFAMDGTILDANDNFLRMVGYTRDEIQGRPHSMFVDVEERSGDEYRALWARLSRGALDSRECRWIGKDGREVWVRATANPIPDHTGKPSRIVEYAIDITAHRQRVERILSSVRAARSGDLTREVDVTGGDAVGQIGEVLNDFLGDLRASIRRIADHAGSLSNAAEELSAVSQLMSSNAEETSEQAKVVASTADQVTTSIQTVASAAEDMTTSIREIAQHAADAATVATTAVDVARQTNETVSKLSDSSAAIGKVIKLITAVAQQTKLLALNATIEAARGGEAGKGFAVVANEVKELAKETASATEDIGHRVEAIQTDSTSVVAAIQQIGSIITDINAMQSSIAGAVDQQTITMSDIRRNAVSAAAGSDEITRNIEEVAKAAHGTTSGACDAQTAASDLARMASDLKTLVGRFVC